MKKEKSCGAVLFREDEERRSYLIIRSVKGHNSLCKGHVEPGETEHQTAIREIFEETALHVEFVENFREVITYSPCEDCIKDVVFFLARVTGGALNCQQSEVEEAWFLPYDQAAVRLTHEGDRGILKKAEDFLNGGR